MSCASDVEGQDIDTRDRELGRGSRGDSDGHFLSKARIGAKYRGQSLPFGARRFRLFHQFPTLSPRAKLPEDVEQAISFLSTTPIAEIRDLWRHSLKKTERYSGRARWKAPT